MLKTYQHSGIKNAAYQTDSGGTVSAVKEYDAFGNDLASSGTWQGPFGYGSGFGYQSTDRSGLMLLGHRYYDPSIGRFLTPDPIKSGVNWYDYCEGNPLSLADPSGLKPRQPRLAERAWIGEAIRAIDPLGITNISMDLKQLLAIGQLLVDDEMVGNDAIVPISLCNLIVSDKIVLNGSLLSALAGDKHKVFRAKWVFEDLSWLEAVLVHEYRHFMNDGFWEAMIYNNHVEAAAWGEEIKYLEQKLRGAWDSTTTRKNILLELIERSKEGQLEYARRISK